MKKGTYLLCLLLLVFISACGGKQSSPPQEATQTSASVIEVIQTPTEETQVVIPGAPQDPGEPDDTAQTGDESQPPPDQNSNLYDPSIYVIEASGTYRMELAPGYYADYEVEIYLDKVDSNDNRVVTGSYQGGLWMKTTIDLLSFSGQAELIPPMIVFSDMMGIFTTKARLRHTDINDDQVVALVNIKFRH